LSRLTEAALRERVKELTCLYGIAQVAATPGLSLDEILQRIADLLPPAWQYPEIASARIVLDGRAHTTRGFSAGCRKQTAEIAVAGARRGTVEVVYSEERPDAHGKVFLREEGDLINEVARQVALIIERRQAEQEKSRIQEQLRHADRLATIGQLAAGVAHELNEPLAGILGLARLAGGPEGLPRQTQEDIRKIERLCLQAREVIKKLLVFARETPPKRMRVDLNEIVRNGMDFFVARCANGGTHLALELTPDLPEITGDPAQLNQVLVNLVVNTLQAMPKGGRLTVRTEAHEDQVSLMVQDTGAGMSEEVLGKIFLPFFTTKGVGEGTGLGLPVVHGIVTAHGGSIAVGSRPGQGTQVEVRLPRAGTGVGEGL